MINRVLQAIKALRAPVLLDEYDLHRMTCQALAMAGLVCEHEKSLGPRCRIDILCGDIGIELKRGKPTKAALVKQLTRYAQTGKLRHIVVVSEHAVDVPESIAGIPLHFISLYKLWGVANTPSLQKPSSEDGVLMHARDALQAAKEALQMESVSTAPSISEAYDEEDSPAYMQDIPQSGHYYGTLTYNVRRKCWTVRGEPCVTEMCKRLFPGSDTGKRGEARFTAHRRIVGDLNWLMLRYPLKIATRDKEKWERSIHEARAYAVKRERMLEGIEGTSAPEGMFLGTLKPFQEKGLNWLIHTPRALLADEMGLGKTLQALCCLCQLRAFPAMVVVPPHLVRNWVSEIERFIRLDDKVPRVHVIKGLTPYQLPEADIYIMHYLLLRGWKKILPDLHFRAVVFDEVQELRRAGT